MEPVVTIPLNQYNDLINNKSKSIEEIKSKLCLTVTRNSFDIYSDPLSGRDIQFVEVEESKIIDVIRNLFNIDEEVKISIVRKRK